MEPDLNEVHATRIRKGRRTKPVPLRKRMLAWAQRLWRPAGTVIAVCLALLLAWHAINGRHGLSVWQQKRAEDRALQQEIKNLEQENAADAPADPAAAVGPRRD